MKVSYNWLKTYFEESVDFPTPEQIEKKLSFYAFEIEEVLFNEEKNDYLIDIDVLPNRAGDCLSHSGIAKEISVLFEIPLKKQELQQVETVAETKLSVKIADGDSKHCRRYCGQRIENVIVKESPQWLKDYLEIIGQRSINNIVDITNYVMFALGQPMHAFDADKIADDTIVVRYAVEGDVLTTLDNNEVNLQSSDLLICDTQKPLALAGVKGGKAAEVDENTTNIILEAANFDPGMTRKTARRTKILTDSSKRFENEPTAELVTEAIQMAAAMVVGLAGTEATTVFASVDEYPHVATRATIEIPHSYIERVMGIQLEQGVITNIFDRFEWEYTVHENGYTVTVPFNRLDLQNKEDLMEDIARVYGYNAIPTVSNLDDIAYVPQMNKRAYVENVIKNILVQEFGFYEVESYSLVDTGELEVASPLAQDKNYFRTTLVPQFEKALMANAQNAQLIGLSDIRIFELSAVYKNNTEQLVFTLGIDPLGKKARNKGTKELRNQIVSRVFEVLGVQSGVEELLVSETGLVSEFDLSAIIEQSNTPQSYEDYVKAFEIPEGNVYGIFQPFSKFPYSTRDIAVWVDTQNDSAQDLAQLLQEQAGGLLVRAPRLVDTYVKEETGKTSYAYRLVFQSFDKTLSDDDITPVMQQIAQVIAEKEWEVR